MLRKLSKTYLYGWKTVHNTLHIKCLLFFNFSGQKYFSHTLKEAFRGKNFLRNFLGVPRSFKILSKDFNLSFKINFILLILRIRGTLCNSLQRIKTEFFSAPNPFFNETK